MNRGNRMNHIIQTTIRILALCLICLLPISSAWSADEDMISQVYLEFDPETGEFKTALDPMAQQKNEHMQAQQIQEIQQNQDNIAGQPSGSNSEAAQVAADVATGQQVSTAGDASGSGNSMMLIAGIVVLLVVIGAVVMMRKNQQAT
jgi:hypothetical protein